MVAIISVGILFLIIYFIVRSYSISIKDSEAAVLNQLKAISCTTSVMISGDDHNYLKDRYQYKDAIKYTEQDSVYQKIYNQLLEAKNVNSISTDIYTMVFDSTQQFFRFIVSSSEIPYYRHSYKKYPKKIVNNYQDGGVLPLYTTENGRWLSAYAPIYDTKGNVSGLIQVDRNFDTYITEARYILLKNLLISLLVVIPFSFILLKYVSNTVSESEQNKKLLREQNIAIKKANEIIEKKNNELEYAVKKRTSDLIHTNKELNTFLYRSSHDIQGPVATIKGLINLIKPEDPSKADSVILHLEKSVDTLMTRIRNINRVYEIRNRKPVGEEIVLTELLGQVINVFQKSLSTLKIDFICDIDKHIKVKSDPELLYIVVFEIVKNSIQFRNTNKLHRPYLRMTASKENKNIKLLFEDNGIGINDQQNEEIFHMFYRGHEYSTGAGLGLYTVTLALQKINGNISFQNNSPTGAIFQIILQS